MTENITLVQNEDSDTTVTIHPTKVEESFAGNPIVLMLPAPIRGSDAVTKFLNLNRVKRVISIIGYIVDNLPRRTAFSTYYTASSKGEVVATERSRLRTMASTNNPIIMNYVNEAGQTTPNNPATWTMMKCSITEVAEDIQTPTKYLVMVQLMEGTNLSE